MMWLLLWPLAGLVFWTVYEAKDFGESPKWSMIVLLGSLIAGPIMWLTLLESEM